VLIGAGRAHLQVLRALSRPLVRGLEIVLVTTDRWQYDPAMTAGLLRGTYAERDARVDVHALAERAGARVVDARADRFAPGAHVVQAGADRIAFDLCSIDEVGLPLDSELPGVVDHAIPLRPASALPEIRQAIESRLDAVAAQVRCTIVGGGSTGVECAFALLHLLRARKRTGIVTIVDSAPSLLADLPECRDEAHRALERAGVCFAFGARAIEAHEDGVLLASGGGLPSDLVIWATGGAPPRLIAESGLPHDDRGRLLVDGRLQSLSGVPIWAAGDCAAPQAAAARDPRRHGEILEAALRSHLGAGRRDLPRPRARPVCLLDTGDGRAIMRWGPIAGRSRLAGWLKRRLDRRFVAHLSGA
jgi:selenide,water dikinase